jgi:hypothetical protein
VCRTIRGTASLNKPSNPGIVPRCRRNDFQNVSLFLLGCLPVQVARRGPAAHKAPASPAEWRGRVSWSLHESGKVAGESGFGGLLCAGRSRPAQARHRGLIAGNLRNRCPEPQAVLKRIPPIDDHDQTGVDHGGTSSTRFTANFSEARFLECAGFPADRRSRRILFLER